MLRKYAQFSNVIEKKPNSLKKHYKTNHNILNRTPSQFLEEVLLVDDFSDKEDLGIGLENYIRYM